ncbi:MAG: hypothetical protein ACOCQA_03400 [bacterium]
MEKIKIKKQCEKCGKEFIVERVIFKNGTINVPKKEKRFCCRSCANSHIQTKEQNDSRSRKLKGNIPWIKGKRFSYEEKIKYFGKRKRNGKLVKIYPVDNILYCKSCGNKLKVKTSKRIKCMKCIQKETGEMRKYRHQCSFKFNVYSYPEEFNIQLLENYGWYSASNRGNNKNGVSRDHMVSVKYGFNNNIPPEIISHPANCRLLTHIENNKKKMECSITINELYKKIEQWNKKYDPVANRQTH